MYQRVLDFCKEHMLIESHDKIIAGISGGADSVCLLVILCQIRETIPIQIHAVHINHGIREEAYQDAEFVTLLCDRLKVPLSIKNVKISQLSAEFRISTEEAGRMARYDAFEEFRIQMGFHKIAVAHNMNDQAETVLFHLFRGTGMRGMAGIRPVREQIIRPLLCLQRWEIEQFLSERGFDYQTDHTNFEDDYTRNRIRNHLIPLAEKMVCTGIVQHINETARIASQAEEYITKQAHQIYLQLASESPKSDRISFKLNELQKVEPLIKTYLLREAMHKIQGTIKDLSSRHLNQISELTEKHVGKQIDLPDGIRAYTTYHALVLEDSNTTRIPKSGKEVCLPLLSKDSETEGTQQYRYEVEDFGTLQIRLFMRFEGQIIPQNLYTKWFDYDKIKKSLQLRNRRQGDYLIVDKKGSRKSLKQYMIDEKIPRELRDQILVLADEDHIVWIPGYRISQSYKIEDQTKKIVEVTITGGIELWQSMSE